METQQTAEFTAAERERIAQSAECLANRIRRPIRLTTGMTDGREWARVGLASGAREGIHTLTVLHCTGDSVSPCTHTLFMFSMTPTPPLPRT